VIRDLLTDLATDVVGPFSILDMLGPAFAIATLFFVLRFWFVSKVLLPQARDRLLEASVVDALNKAEARAPEFVARAREVRDGSTIPGWALRVATMAARDTDVDPTTRGEIVDAVFRPSLETRSLP
jgi:hypothetical protein